MRSCCRCLTAKCELIIVAMLSKQRSRVEWYYKSKRQLMKILMLGSFHKTRPPYEWICVRARSWSKSRIRIRVWPSATRDFPAWITAEPFSSTPTRTTTTRDLSLGETMRFLGVERDHLLSFDPQASRGNKTVRLSFWFNLFELSTLQIQVENTEQSKAR